MKNVLQKNDTIMEFQGMVKFDKKTEEILASLEKTQHDFWNLDRFSAQFLYTLIKIKNAKNVWNIRVEI